jgi:hypothetical protein
MNKLVASFHLAGVAGFAVSTQAQLVAYEPFSYASGANLQIANSGTGWAGHWSYDSFGTASVIPGLTWKDSAGRPLSTSATGSAATPTRAVHLAIASGVNWFMDRQLALGGAGQPALLFADGTDYWISFLIRFSTPMTNRMEGGLSAIPEAGQTGTWAYIYQTRLFAGGPDNQPSMAPAVSFWNSPTGSNPVPQGGGTTQLYVVHLHGIPGGGDSVTLFVDPSLTGVAPPTATLSDVSNAAGAAVSKTIRLSMKLDNGSAPISVDFDEIRVGLSFADVTPIGQCGLADIAGQGGVAGFDGLLDNNDFVVYIDRFFNANPLADVGSQGGIAGADGLFDNNDFVVFIDRFFAGC